MREDRSLNPRAVGAQGERGWFQLKPGGELDRFMQEGHTAEDAFDPRLNAEYGEEQLTAGRISPWIAADSECFE